MIECDIQNPNNFTTVPDVLEIQQWVDEAVQTPDANLTLVIRFVDEIEGRELNKSYRKKDYATNVLSFSYEADDFGIPELLDQAQHIGDLILCESVIKKEANQQNKTLLQHWAHMIIHGVLHLQGYDHLNDDEANKMESLEISILEKLGFNNPYQQSYV